MIKTKGFEVGAWVKLRYYRNDRYWETLPYGVIRNIDHRQITVEARYLDDHRVKSRFETTTLPAKQLVLFEPSEDEVQQWSLAKMKK